MNATALTVLRSGLAAGSLAELGGKHEPPDAPMPAPAAAVTSTVVRQAVADGTAADPGPQADALTLALMGAFDALAVAGNPVRHIRYAARARRPLVYIGAEHALVGLV